MVDKDSDIKNDDGFSFSFDDFLKLPVIRWFHKKLTTKKKKVGMLRFAGVIADTTMQRKGIAYNMYVKAIDKLFDKDNLEAAILVINSPGGSPAQTSLIASHIRQRADEAELPVYVFVEDVAASGGYWLACAGDEIYAQASSVVGSIGVISAGFGFEDLIAKYDIHRRVYTSGKDKSFMDPFVSVKAKDEKHLKELQKNIHTAFIDWVKERRHDKMDTNDDGLFEGQFWDAVTGKELGLVDDIAGMQDFLRKKYGAEYKVIDCTPSGALSLSSIVNSKGKSISTALGGNIAEDALQVIEEKSIWSRYGL